MAIVLDHGFTGNESVTVKTGRAAVPHPVRKPVTINTPEAPAEAAAPQRQTITAIFRIPK